MEKPFPRLAMLLGLSGVLQALQVAYGAQGTQFSGNEFYSMALVAISVPFLFLGALLSLRGNDESPV